MLFQKYLIGLLSVHDDGGNGGDAGAGGDQGNSNNNNNGNNNGNNNQGSNNNNNGGTNDQGTSNDGKKYTDEDVNRMINAAYAKWAAKKDSEVSEAARLAALSAEDRATEWEKKYNALHAEAERNKLVASAKDLLTTEGVTVSSAIVEYLVADTAETTMQNVKSFVKDFRKAVKDEVAKTLAGGKTPKGNGGGTLTKEDILKVQNPIERQRLIQQNINLFKN